MFQIHKLRLKISPYHMALYMERVHHPVQLTVVGTNLKLQYIKMLKIHKLQPHVLLSPVW